MQKAYSRIIYKNYPSTDTPLNETNLNHMDGALDIIDDRVVAMDTTKANQADMLQAIKTITYNDATGVFTITFFNNTSITIDTDIEKIAINFDYDDDPTSQHYQQIIIELDDGTYKYIDLSALITQYEFNNSGTIAFTVSGGSVSANVVDGSITEAKLQPNFLADVKAEVAKAEDFSEDAEAWAKGTRGGDPVESTDPTYNNNAKHYSEVASDEKDSAEAWANGEINGQPVPSTHPAYQNNAKYYKDLANPTTFKALTDVTTDQSFNGIDMTGIQDGQTIIYDGNTGNMVPGDAGGAAINDIVNIYGAKNFYAIDKSDNVLCTINDDGSISLSGTVPTMEPNEYLEIVLFTGTEKDRIPAGDYILDASLVGTSTPTVVANGVYVYFYYDFIGHPAWTQTKLVQLDSNYATETHKTRDFTIASSEYELYISKCCLRLSGLLSGCTLNSTLKIMVYDANLKTDKFVPYAMTNRQLTLKHNVKDMNDAVINNPTPGQTLVYNSEGKLENATPSGSGHTMINSAGTQLPQRTGLQGTGGLNVTDDSNNNRTVVDDNYEVIPWTTWQGYTAAQKAQHPNAIVTDAPDCDGDVEIEFMKLAWTNPNPSSNFTAKTIPLDTDGDYDFIRIKAKSFYTDTDYFYRDFKKGEEFSIETGTVDYSRLLRRNGTFASSTQISFSLCDIRDTFNSSGQTSSDARFIIPLEVYVYKTDFTAKIKAIAHDVSTDASKCMMSDGVTDVETALNNYSATEHLVGHWYGLPLYEKTISMGAAPNANNLAVAHGITNLAAIIDIRGIAIRVNPFQVIPLPHATNPVTNNIQLYADATNVNMSTYADMSVFSYCYITIRYTKSS